MKREQAKGVEEFLKSVYLREDYLARFRQNSIRDAASLESGRINFVNILALLGTPYPQAGQQEQALEQYQSAFIHINEWKLRYPYRDRLYAGMGEFYHKQ